MEEDHCFQKLVEVGERWRRALAIDLARALTEPIACISVA